VINLLVYEKGEQGERVVERHDVTHRRPEERERLRATLEIAYATGNFRVEEKRAP